MVFGLGFWQTSLLCIVEELAEGGYVDVAVGVGVLVLMLVTDERCQVTFDT